MPPIVMKHIKLSLPNPRPFLPVMAIILLSFALVLIIREFVAASVFRVLLYGLLLLGEGIMVYWIVVTEAKRAEEILYQSEVRYRTLVERLPVITYVADLGKAMTTRYISPQAEATLGFSQHDFKSDPSLWSKVLYPEDRQRILNELSSCKSSGNPLISEYRMLSRNGQIFWFHDEATFTSKPNSDTITQQGVIIDITKRKRAEETLRIERKRLYSLLYELPGFLCVIAQDYSITFANREFIRLFGEPGTHKCYDIMRDLGNPCNECICFRALNGKTPVKWEWVRDDGSTYAIVNYPFSDISNNSLIVTLGIDITEHKKVQEELMRLDRLNLIGEMAAGIGHEVRNPMTTVRGFLQILSGKDECKKFKEYYDLMIGELDRINSIITEFLSLSRNQAAEKKPVNLNSILTAISPLIEADAIKGSKRIVWELGSIPDLLLSEKEIIQVILNLVRNGLDASPVGSDLTIMTFLDSDVVVLAVRDKGEGITSEVLSKIGTPFFTTKDNGTGLGLAVCYSIIERHNGIMEIKTGSNGTTVMVKF